MHFTLIKPLLISTLLILAGTTAADCCSGGCTRLIPCPGKAGYCPQTFCCDGSQLGIFSCCGVGACNIFCCNCDDGCLGGSDNCPNICGSSTGNDQAQHELRSPFNIDGDENEKCLHKFDAADKNNDGKLSYLEWATYVAGDQLVNLTEAKERWSLFDEDNEGYLTKEQAYNRKA